MGNAPLRPVKPPSSFVQKSNYTIMHNVVLSPIDPEILINTITERVTENILKAVKLETVQTKQPEQLLTVQEAANFLNLTTPTIYSKVSRGELPVMKQGKRLYFSSVELMDYLKAGRKKPYDEIQLEADRYFKQLK